MHFGMLLSCYAALAFSFNAFRAIGWLVFFWRKTEERNKKQLYQITYQVTTVAKPVHFTINCVRGHLNKIDINILKYLNQSKTPNNVQNIVCLVFCLVFRVKYVLFEWMHDARLVHKYICFDVHFFLSLLYIVTLIIVYMCGDTVCVCTKPRRNRFEKLVRSMCDRWYTQLKREYENIGNNSTIIMNAHPHIGSSEMLS